MHWYYAWWGAKKYHHPSEELLVVGVTGTSGKSSTVSLLRQLLEAAGFVVGSLSTIDFSIAGENKLNNQKMTMLGRAQTQQYLREMVHKGCQIAIVENTSEGSVQHRFRFTNYDFIAFTNLYPEHIESHGSFENYKAAKLRIFEYIAKYKRKNIKDIKIKIPGWEETVPKMAILNANSEHVNDFSQFPFDEVSFFSRSDKKMYIDDKEKNNLLSVENIRSNKEGLAFTLHGKEIQTKMYGEYNVMNIVAAVSIARVLKIDWDILINTVQKFQGVPGRIEFIPEAEEKNFQVIVDYAFEPVAMKALYDVVQLISPKRIIHVFGSTGGGRDKERRFTVGKFVAENANICIITDEDPYDDNPQDIINDVARACTQAGKVEGKDLFKMVERGKAIEEAIMMAGEGDLVLVTGKGSEQAMVVKGELVPWDDRDVVRSAISKRTN